MDRSAVFLSRAWFLTSRRVRQAVSCGTGVWQTPVCATGSVGRSRARAGPAVHALAQACLQKVLQDRGAGGVARDLGMVRLAGPLGRSRSPELPTTVTSNLVRQLHCFGEHYTLTVIYGWSLSPAAALRGHGQPRAVTASAAARPGGAHAFLLAPCPGR